MKAAQNTSDNGAFRASLQAELILLRFATREMPRSDRVLNIIEFKTTRLIQIN